MTTHYPAARTAVATAQTFAWLTAAVGLAALTGCSETALSPQQGAVEQVVSGTVEATDGPVAGATVCSAYTPEAMCAITDPAGAFDLRVPASTKTPYTIALTVDAEGYESMLYPVRVASASQASGPVGVSVPMRTVLEAATDAKWGGYDEDPERGRVRLEVARASGSSSARIWEAMRAEEGTGDGAVYADADGRLQPRLGSTSEHGTAVLPNVEPGMAELRLTSTTAPARCAMTVGFGGGDVEVMAGRATYVRAVCYALPVEGPQASVADDVGASSGGADVAVSWEGPTDPA